jgi:hypothetical protein
MTQNNNRELWAAFVAILVITLLYIFSIAMLGVIPGASDLIGHGMGILGFILMVVTETFYSWRKRSRQAHWGRMSQWLNFHIFTGIVGPYLVLLHTAWRFNGLAGLSMLLTIFIVASGFIGRYIYTSVPRSADGAEIEANQLEEQIAALQSELQTWAQTQPQTYASLKRYLPADGEPSDQSAAVIFNRSILDWKERLRWRRARHRIDPGLRAQADALDGLIRRQQTLRRQVASLAMARRMLALWHAVHVPIGMVLFIAAGIHILAAFYFATLLR